MPLNTDINAKYENRLADEAAKFRGFEKAVLKVGTDTFNRQIGSGSTRAKEFAIEKALTAMSAHGRQLQKSAVDSTSNAYSNDFNYPPTPAQAAAAATRALQVQGLANAIGRKIQAMDAADNAPDVNVIIEDHSYGGFETTQSISAPRAAAGANVVWPLDMASPRQWQASDEENGIPTSNYESDRNRNNPSPSLRPMGDATSFSKKR